MNFPWTHLSRPFDELDELHDILVVGSGYGGGVAASRLARAGQKVTLLERGREIGPGDYPENAKTAAGEFQTHLSRTGKRIGKADALYDLRVGDDVNVLVGCGLGGTSLINANVAIEPDPRVYDAWPEPFNSDPDALREYFERARTMLGSTPYPATRKLPKLDALKQVADGFDGAQFTRPDINVTFENGTNTAGVWQAACNDCGNCVSGCNVGAKNTVLMNYLPDARAHGCRIFTGVLVRSIHKVEDGWTIDVENSTGEETKSLSARTVILAAGTLGTTEILLRSAQAGLALSERLGERFSGNGDVYAFGYNASLKTKDARKPVYGVGARSASAAAVSPDASQRPGPCIAGMVDLRDAEAPLKDGIILQEGVMPGALTSAYATGFPTLAALVGDPFRYGDVKDRLQDIADIGEEATAGHIGDLAYAGPVSRTLPFLAMSHDAGDGSLRLRNDTVTVTWSGAGKDAAILRDETVIRRACDAIRAEYLPMPLWQDAFGRRLVTVHPLGGAAMGDDVASGVVDGDGRVFDPDGGVHRGLLVMDGAVIPGAVGVNPHLTITAFAERAVARLAQRRGWIIDYATKPVKVAPSSAPKPQEKWERAADELLAGLTKLRGSIDRKCWWLARKRLKGLWTRFAKVYVGQFDDWAKRYPLPDQNLVIEVLGERDALMSVVGPLIDQIIAIIEPALTHYQDGKLDRAITHLEETLGDFSPAVSFDERMTGRISNVGLHDTTEPSRPYKVAAAGLPNAQLEARIWADSVRAAIDPPDGEANIRGTLQCDFLGGERVFKGNFRFLMPDPTDVECWEMTYRGTLAEGVEGSAELSFDGRKTLRRRERTHWWTDLTELSVDISDEKGVIGRGVLEVGFEDVIDQANGLTIAFGTKTAETGFAEVFDRITATIKEELTDLVDLFDQRAFRALVVKAAATGHRGTGETSSLQTNLEQFYTSRIFARMGETVLRSYGGIAAYMANFPARQHEQVVPNDRLEPPEVFHPVTADGAALKLTRYCGGDRGPVLVAGGFGTRASSFATRTVDTSFAEALVAAGYDVWLFDYRGSGEIEASRSPFNLDDVAQFDWPAAIDTVTAQTGQETVQVVAHCVGSMSLFMALLRGEKRVRSIIASQIGPHAVTNWFNYAKGDARIANMVANGLPKGLHNALYLLGSDRDLEEAMKNGLKVIDPRSAIREEIRPDDLGLGTNLAIDAMLWKTPSFAPTPCYSPTCHRITAIFGPSYDHGQLNQKTHDAIAQMFGPVSTSPFLHIAEIFRTGQVVGTDGFDYLGQVNCLKLPIHFIAGARNKEMLPEATLRSLDWLRRANPDAKHLYSRTVVQHYAHMDCFIGKNAARDVFPSIIAKLTEHKGLSSQAPTP